MIGDVVNSRYGIRFVNENLEVINQEGFRCNGKVATAALYQEGFYTVVSNVFDSNRKLQAPRHGDIVTCDAGKRIITITNGLVEAFDGCGHRMDYGPEIQNLYTDRFYTVIGNVFDVEEE
jgi:hypothetical protein